MSSMTETQTQTPWVSNSKRGLLTETITIDGTDYTVDKDDIFVSIGEKYPQLRPHIVGMFQRAGSTLAGMRYPAKVAEMPLNDKTVAFLAPLLDLMPADSDASMAALDEAVEAVTEFCDTKALAIRRLVQETFVTF